MKGPETERSHKIRSENGFYTTYMSGKGLDIGYKGSVANAEPVLETAIGVDTDYPGYDGVTLPFANESQDYIFSSHTLEHVENWIKTIQEWHRVVKVGGHIITIVPHKYLYEKKRSPPSNWNRDHKRFYTPGLLLLEIESALDPNSYRVVHMQDNDTGFNYNIHPEQHSDGAYEIVCVIKKIDKPKWNLL